MKYLEQKSFGLKKSAGELTSERDSANAELSVVLQYTKLNDSDVGKTKMFRSSRNKSWRQANLFVPQERVQQCTVEQIVDGTMPQVHGQYVDVVKVILQNQISERNVEHIVEVVHSIPMEVESSQMERVRGTSR